MIFVGIRTLVGPESQFRLGDRRNSEFTNRLTSDVLAENPGFFADQKNADVRVEEEFLTARGTRRQWVPLG